MKKILVIGASGFVGKPVAKSLLVGGYAVRCVARNPAKVADLATLGGEIVQGDVSDLASMQQALNAVDAVYITIHTLSTQHPTTAGQDFMAVELNGLQNIVTACRTNGVRRLIYVTFLGVAPDAPSAWVRGRWQAEQFLLKSGLDVTIIRPGMIVGLGGQGFTMMVANARRRVAVVIGSGQQRFRNIAIDDLVYYLVGVLNEPRTYGQSYDVGSDDILTGNQMIDAVAEVLGRPHPGKFHISRTVLRAVAPLIERIARLPNGAIKGMLDSMKTDAVGDPAAIRTILPRSLLSNRRAVERALAATV